MCARYSLTQEGISILIGEIEIILAIGARYNIAPTQKAPVIVADATGTRAVDMNWGWQLRTQTGTKLLVNAKSETLSSLPTFRPYLGQRCLIPADGFYEWTADKTPIRFMRRHSEPFCFAGLWRTTQRRPLDETITEHHFVILTRPSVAPVSRFHNRLAFVVKPEFYRDWLETNGSLDTIIDRPDETPFDFVPVQRELNNVKNEGAHLIKPGLLQAELL